MRTHGSRVARLMLPLALAAGACAPHMTNGSATPGLTLEAAPVEARAGSTVTLTLVNGSAHEAGYNLCVAALDRRVDGEWQEHPERPAEVCTMELRIVRPGESGTFQHTLPRAVPAGTYRFRTGVDWPFGEGNVGIVSNELNVLP
jgi:hypothetical protein